MNIASRGQLLELIEEKGVETFVTQETEGKKVTNTIIHCTEKRKFYRLVWGEIKTSDEVSHFWYEEQAEEVTLDPSGKLWLTKEEKKMKQEEMLDKMNKINLENLQENLSFSTQEDNDKIKYVGGAAGKGKTTYVLTQVVEKLKEGKSVLLLNDELTNSEMVQKSVEILKELHGESEEGALVFLENAKLTVDNNEFHNWDSAYILNEIDVAAGKEGGVDFVAIDGLKATPINNETFNQAVQKIKDEIEAKASEHNFEVLFSFQLKNDRAAV